MRLRLVPAALLASVVICFALQSLTSYAYSTFGRWPGSQALFYVNPANQDLSQAAAERRCWWA